MTSLKIGMIDLDTTHPGNWLPLFRKRGHEVTAVFDIGGVYPAGHAVAFAEKHGVAHVCESLDEMVAAVDAVFIHSCDWDQHLVRARPFVDAGKAIFIDKPMAGRLADVEQLLEGAIVREYKIRRMR